MTQRIGAIHARDTARRDEFPITFENGSGETAPAFALLQVDTVEGVPLDKARVVTIVKPDSTDGVYLVNGPIAVRAGKRGRCRINGPMTIAYTGSAPALGDTVGPSSGSWLASTTGDGYDVLGGAEEDVVLCNPTGGGVTKVGCILKATATIAGATDSGGTRTPTQSDDYTFIQGDDPGSEDIYHWSTVDISEDSYMAVVKFDDQWTIVNAFC